MQAFFVKKNGEFIKKLGTKSVPRIYATKGHANNAISQLADADRRKDHTECYDRLKRANWDREMDDFCEEGVPPIGYYTEFYSIVEAHE